MTAVDNEPAMLAALRLSEPVLADITTVRLGRRFDAVLLTSHLVNHPDPATVRALLRTVRIHLRGNRFAVIERYPRGWVATCTERTTERDGVRFHLCDIDRRRRRWRAQRDDGLRVRRQAARTAVPGARVDESLLAGLRARVILLD